MFTKPRPSDSNATSTPETDTAPAAPTPPAGELRPSSPSISPAPLKPKPAASVLSSDITITGNVRSSGDIQIEGTIEGDILWVEWIKPGNAVAAIFPARGRGWLRISRDQKVMEGRWGFDDDNANGGPWKAEKSSFQ